MFTALNDRRDRSKTIIGEFGGRISARAMGPFSIGECGHLVANLVRARRAPPAASAVVTERSSTFCSGLEALRTDKGLFVSSGRLRSLRSREVDATALAPRNAPLEGVEDARLRGGKFPLPRTTRRRSRIEQFVQLVRVESGDFSATSNPTMTQPLQVGDRVRLTPKYQGQHFHPGDTGTIVDVVPAASSHGKTVYQVCLDVSKAMRFPTFYEDELERV
jgi:hypothetical protein